MWTRNEEHYADIDALKRAACQCKNTVDTFLERIKRYQPYLRAGGSGSGVRDGWFKIKCALCKKDGLANFKADLIRHTESIKLLLTTLHIGSLRIADKKREESNRTLAERVQDSYLGCMQRVSQVPDCVSTGVQQGKRILEKTAKAIQTNLQTFHVVLNIKSIIAQFPGQVERQQSVHFIDALGRHTPFNLEFIMSTEALTSVLRSNFKKIGSGTDKIERG